MPPVPITSSSGWACTAITVNCRSIPAFNLTTPTFPRQEGWALGVPAFPGKSAEPSVSFISLWSRTATEGDREPGEGRMVGGSGRHGPAGPYADVVQDRRFRLLRTRFRRLAIGIVASFLGWYFLYISLSAFARDFMAYPAIGNINVALLL